MEEKLAIKELEQKLKLKTESIEKLEARINDLEQRLRASGEFVAIPELEKQTSNPHGENNYHLRKLFGEWLKPSLYVECWNHFDLWVVDLILLWMEQLIIHAVEYVFLEEH